jgi:hypothetical protein
MNYHESSVRKGKYFIDSFGCEIIRPTRVSLNAYSSVERLCIINYLSFLVYYPCLPLFYRSLILSIILILILRLVFHLVKLNLKLLALLTLNQLKFANSFGIEFHFNVSLLHRVRSFNEDGVNPNEDCKN